jgi:hypothetical protein
MALRPSTTWTCSRRGSRSRIGDRIWPSDRLAAPVARRGVSEYRLSGQPKIDIDPDRLRDAYVVEARSCADIGREVGANPNTVNRRLHALGIPVRSPWATRTRADPDILPEDVLSKKYLSDALVSAVTGNVCPVLDRQLRDVWRDCRSRLRYASGVDVCRFEGRASGHRRRTPP